MPQTTASLLQSHNFNIHAHIPSVKLLKKIVNKTRPRRGHGLPLTYTLGLTTNIDNHF